MNFTSHTLKKFAELQLLCIVLNGNFYTEKQFQNNIKILSQQ